MLSATNNATDDSRRSNPNGDGVYRARSQGQVPPVEPPKKVKGKSPIWAKVLISLGVLILVASVGTYVAVKLVLNHVSDSVDQTKMLGDAGVKAGDKSALDGALNVLMVGTDERPGLEGSRADTIIVLHVKADHSAAYLLSMPRDTLVNIPAFPKAKFNGSKEKINAAYEFGAKNNLGRTGGFELLAKTVSQVTGLTFNAGAIVNFNGFEAVVNALGGVDMCIDERTVSFDHDRNGNRLDEAVTHVPAAVYNVGCQHLKPWQALDFVRQRHSVEGGDYGRQRHQQQFIKAIAKAALSQGLTDPVKLNRVMTAAGKALTVDPGAASLTDWIFALKGLGVEKLTMINTNGGKYASVACPDGSSCQTLTADSVAMFAAAQSDTMADFITKHPTWVAADK